MGYRPKIQDTFIRNPGPHNGNTKRDTPAKICSKCNLRAFGPPEAFSDNPAAAAVALSSALDVTIVQKYLISRARKINEMRTGLMDYTRDSHSWTFTFQNFKPLIFRRPRVRVYSMWFRETTFRTLFFFSTAPLILFFTPFCGIFALSRQVNGQFVLLFFLFHSILMKI